METLDDRGTTGSVLARRPIVLVAFCAGHATFTWLPLDGGAIRVGRETHPGLELDGRMSREHVEIACDDGEWSVRDLESRNGTFVDGVQIAGVRRGPMRVIRCGQTVLLPIDDGWATVAARPPKQGDFVIGVKLQQALAHVARAASVGGNALVIGESGAGKELAAKTFHKEGPNRGGPFVAVNCATIPHGLAERVLFGAKKGAFSGANADVDGYVQSADRGVLFLDELGELELEVQAKLLRFLETKEATPLGATRAQKVDVKLCFATHRDLRRAMGDGKFRSDLYYRVAQPEIALPPLRERLEEIPWHLVAELQAIDPAFRVSAELVEACMLRTWPGNVRELRAECRRMAYAAGERSRTLRPEALDPRAGASVGPSEAPPAVVAASEPPRDGAKREPITKERIEAAFREHASASAVATALGIHRSHLYRLMKTHGVERAGDDE
jgi:DNA-binding NtrC family response regulator